MGDAREYGIVLTGGIVAPAVNEQAAIDQGAALGRPVVRLDPDGWRVVVHKRPVLWTPPWPRRDQCRRPSHRTVHTHRQRRELWCGRCLTWWAEYERGRRAVRRDRQVAA